VIGLGTDTVGGVWSATVTLKVFAADALLAESFAVHETVVVPSGKFVPEFLLQVTVGEGSIRSVAETV
jgi:hypothetical protein